jgi:lipopolysaccharide/colanic/teichoic acid biosynthesis glycosyltransferase
MLQEQPSPISGRLVNTAAADEALYFTVKRTADLILAGLLIVALSPVIAVIALAIKLDSPGPVFFRQERVGSRRRRRGGATRWETRIFWIYKFRSMVQNADQSLHQAHIRAFVQGEIATEGAEQNFKLTGDPRVTRVGKILRRTSLDELPQLFNVILGEMSLVGPRPVPTYEVEGYQSAHYERLAAPPGITGLWQVEGRSRVTFNEMVEMDIDYVRRRSLLLDLSILLRTVPAVLAGRGAA